MTEMVEEKMPVMSTWKVRMLGGAVSLLGIVAYASAAVDLNATIGPIIDSFTDLIPSIIALIVSLVPAVLTLAIVGMIIGICEAVTGKFKF